MAIQYFKFAMTFSLLLLVSACGGGGSDSGGDSADAVTVQFQGAETVTVSVGGGALQDVGSFNLSAAVSSDVVTITDSNNNQFAGIVEVNGSFIARGIGILGEVAPGVRCGGINIRYLGTLGDAGISGSSEGTTECDSDAGKVATVRKGTFTVSL